MKRKLVNLIIKILMIFETSRVVASERLVLLKVLDEDQKIGSILRIEFINDFCNKEDLRCP